MKMREMPDWDALAPYWHCFELGGFNLSTLNSVMGQLIPPVLYVGGGRGTYPVYLKKWLGRDNVTVVDFSEEMVRRANADYGLGCIMADVRHLPLSDNAFSSILCVTGVLEYLEFKDRKIALQEMARVCCNDGLVIVIASSLPKWAKKMDGSRLSFDEHRHLDTWFRHYDILPYPEKRMMRSFNAVAKEVGNRSIAYDLMRNSLPKYTASIEFGQFTTTVSAAGLQIRSSQFLADRGLGIWNLISVPD